jgi:TatD DNase family protein
MVDSHCHLADPAYRDDLTEVVERAKAAGVERALCVLAAGDPEEAAQAERLRALWPDVRFSIGVHPHQAGQFADRTAEASLAVARAAEELPAVAIGEIGLDYHYDFSPRAAQQEVFRRQLGLARDLGLPVIIHTREADEDTVRILREERAETIGGVFHCFTGNGTLARQAMDLGFLVSFAGILTFPRAAELRDVARQIPADRVLVETDSPFLAPVPYRGKRNEPAWVRQVLLTLAGLYGEPPETLEARIDGTFDATFETRGARGASPRIGKPGRSTA